MEWLIEKSPRWVKTAYVSLFQAIKHVLAFTGLLAFIDQKAKTNPSFHYLRSLFAVYQLKDMIQLDVPWWTYPAISTLEHYIQGLDHLPTVFEYGSGASTIWLAKRSASVISIEHNNEWYQKLKNEIIPFKNIQLLLKEPEGEDFTPYVNAIHAFDQPFDIIVIDGRSRNACLDASLAHLKPQGLIVFDNSNRDRYQDALNQSNMSLIRYPGRVPGSPFQGETSILFFVGTDLVSARNLAGYSKRADISAAPTKKRSQ